MWWNICIGFFFVITFQAGKPNCHCLPLWYRYGAEMPVVLIQSLIYLGIIAMTRLARPNISKLCYRRSDKSITLIHTLLKMIAAWSIVAAYVVPFVLIPHTIHPLLGWSLYFLGTFALCFIAINALLLPMLPVLALWLGFLGVLFVMAFPWYPNGVVRALSVFAYAFCAAPFAWLSLVKVMSSIQAAVEREAYFPKIGWVFSTSELWTLKAHCQLPRMKWRQGLRDGLLRQNLGRNEAVLFSFNFWRHGEKGKREKGSDGSLVLHELPLFLYHKLHW